jgi:hypothetical protein
MSEEQKTEEAASHLMAEVLLYSLNGAIASNIIMSLVCTAAIAWHWYQQELGYSIFWFAIFALALRKIYTGLKLGYKIYGWRTKSRG